VLAPLLRRPAPATGSTDDLKPWRTSDADQNTRHDISIVSWC
jgi:hypothetical protein